MTRPQVTQCDCDDTLIGSSAIIRNVIVKVESNWEMPRRTDPHHEAAITRHDDAPAA
jgi:hypothetical protein